MKRILIGLTAFTFALLWTSQAEAQSRRGSSVRRSPARSNWNSGRTHRQPTVKRSFQPRVKSSYRPRTTGYAKKTPPRVNSGYRPKSSGYGKKTTRAKSTYRPGTGGYSKTIKVRQPVKRNTLSKTINFWKNLRDRNTKRPVILPVKRPIKGGKKIIHPGHSHKHGGKHGHHHGGNHGHHHGGKKHHHHKHHHHRCVIRIIGGHGGHCSGTIYGGCPPAFGGVVEPFPGGIEEPIPGGGTDPLPGGGTDPLPGGGTDPLPGGGTDPLPGGGTDPLPGGGTDPLPGGKVDPKGPEAPLPPGAVPLPKGADETKDPTPGKDEPKAKAMPQIQRFLKLKNDTKLDLTVYIQYRTNVAGKWVWVPAEAGKSDKALKIELAPGKELIVTDGKEKIAASRIRMWAVTKLGTWMEYKAKDLWIVGETDDEGYHVYQAPEMGTFTFVFPGAAPTSQQAQTQLSPDKE